MRQMLNLQEFLRHNPPPQCFSCDSSIFYFAVLVWACEYSSKKVNWSVHYIYIISGDAQAP